MPVYHRWKFKVDFCGITEMRYSAQDGEWKLLRFNQTRVIAFEIGVGKLSYRRRIRQWKKKG
jgi:hypothetical protein